jgi:hypothetical protein
VNAKLLRAGAGGAQSRTSLTVLATRFPDVHELRKWTGRESVIRFPVPHLGVTWGETVNLAALDPARLVEARRRLGIPISSLLQRSVLRIPLERIAGQPAVVYDSRAQWRNIRPHLAGVPEVPPTPTSHRSTLPRTKSSPKYLRGTWTISSSSETLPFRHSVSCSSGTYWSPGPLT